MDFLHLNYGDLLENGHFGQKEVLDFQLISSKLHFSLEINVLFPLNLCLRCLRLKRKREVDFITNPG